MTVKEFVDKVGFDFIKGSSIVENYWSSLISYTQKHPTGIIEKETDLEPYYDKPLDSFRCSDPWGYNFSEIAVKMKQEYKFAISFENVQEVEEFLDYVCNTYPQRFSDEKEYAFIVQRAFVEISFDFYRQKSTNKFCCDVENWRYHSDEALKKEGYIIIKWTDKNSKAYIKEAFEKMYK